MKKYFVYDDEYISGNTYFIRFFLNSFLALILVGLYLQSVNVYKRGRSLGFGKDACVAWGIWGFLQNILALFPTALFTNVIPHFYLWFSNGKTKTKEEKIKEDLYSELQSALELYDQESLQSKVAEQTAHWNIYEAKDPPISIKSRNK